MKKRITTLQKLLFVSALLLGFTSCQLFENDVADFFEKYTETAAIENHNISVQTYNDEFSQLCIASEEDAEIQMYMRNPKKFNLLPSVVFENLDSQFSRASVDISQTDSNTLLLLLPQDFLIPADEDHDITAEISLYEPMSGRSFDKYTINLHCNTKPPVILNPTVINNANSTFVVAFDMPSPEEVAIRHKDISAIEINGQSYPVTISTIADPDVEGAYIAEYAIDDSHFSRTAASNYTFIGGKDFTSKASTSFFYDTGEAFFAGDKEYTLVLKDSAGLTSTVKASTSISKLNKPVLKDQAGSKISENGITGIPFDVNTMMGKITIEPPVQDHLGNAVSGTTVHYKVYEATGSGLVYTSGSTSEIKTIELPQNSYRVEAYATLTNYENSSTTIVKFRFINNILYVKAGFENGDGSEGAPYGTIAEAIADINARENHETRFTIYAEDDGTTKLNEDIVLSGNFNTDIFTIAKKPGSASATIKSLKLENDLPFEFDFTASGLTISGSAAEGICLNADCPVALENITVKDSAGVGLKVTAGSPSLSEVDVSNSASDGIEITGGSLVYDKGNISNNGGNGINVSGGSLTYKTGSISGNTENGINLSGGSITYTSGTIKENTKDGINISGGLVTYKDGTISSNGKNGINVSGAANTLMLTFEKGSIKSNGKHGIQLNDAKIEIKEGLISSNTDHGIYASEGIVDLYAVTVSENENGIFSTGTVNLNEGNPTITANRGYGIKNFGGSINIYDGSITDNEDSGIITTNGLFGVTCNLYGGSITGNKNGGLTKTSSAYVTNTNWNVKGAPVVYNNTSGSGAGLKKYNIVLTGNQLLTVKGQLTSGCLLGITTDDDREPQLLGDIYSFTSGYGQYNTDSPSNYFKSDRGFSIVADDSGSEIQAAIAKIGAEGNASYTAYDYLFTFEADQQTYLALPDTARNNISLSFEVYRLDPPDPLNPSDPRTQRRLYPDGDQGRLYEDSYTQYMDPSSEAGALMEVSAALYNGDIKIEDLEIERWYNSLDLRIPGLPNDDVYTIRIYITYLGLSHGTELTYKVVTPRQEFTSEIDVLPAGTDGTAGTDATYVLFGDYPQTVVPQDSNLIVDKSVKYEAGYCLGDDGYWYAYERENRQTNNYINYSDNSEPKKSDQSSFRFFKVEPVKWRVITTDYDHDLDGATAGKWLLLAETCLSSCKFNALQGSYSYGNYPNSNIESYLNTTLMNKIFTSEAQELILTTTVNNSKDTWRDEENAHSTTSFNTSKYNTNTSDKLFALSLLEATTSAYGFGGYGTSDATRKRTPTDYAIATNLSVDSNQRAAAWWTRSPSNEITTANPYLISANGAVSTGGNAPHNSYIGVVPALCINPQ